VLSKEDEALLKRLLSTHSLSDESSIKDKSYLQSKKTYGNVYVKFILEVATKDYREYIHGRTTEGIMERLKVLYSTSKVKFHLWSQYWVEDMQFALKVVSLIKHKNENNSSGFEHSFRSKLDTNKDGLISEREFLDYIRQHQQPN
jgi:hypothetical protein